MKKVLVVYNTMTGNTKVAAEAIAEGVVSGGGEALLRDAKDATVDEFLQSDAVAFGSYDAFSYMGGGLKSFFDNVYYPVKGKVDGKPYAAFLTHGGGGKAISSIESIANAMKLFKASESVSVAGRPDEAAKAKLKQLGAALAASSKK